MRSAALVLALDLTYTIKVQQRGDLLKADKFLSNITEYRLGGQICHYGTEVAVKAYCAQLMRASAENMGSEVLDMPPSNGGSKCIFPMAGE